MSRRPPLRGERSGVPDAAPKGGNPTPDTLGIKGPIGLGVRVPMLVVSPFSRGGHIVSHVFDHTSQLELIGQRFGVEVPNLLPWRHKTVGDLTSTLFRSRQDTQVPKLPPIVIPTTGACDTNSQNSRARQMLHPGPDPPADAQTGRRQPAGQPLLRPPPKAEST